VLSSQPIQRTCASARAERAETVSVWLRLAPDRQGAASAGCSRGPAAAMAPPQPARPWFRMPSWPVSSRGWPY